jgi:hypothetical protein
VSKLAQVWKKAFQSTPGPKTSAKNKEARPFLEDVEEHGERKPDHRVAKRELREHGLDGAHADVRWRLGRRRNRTML